MKKFLSVLGVVLCLFVTVSCSSKIGAVKKAFVGEGYEWEQIELKDDTEEGKQTESVVKGLYYASKGLTSHALIVELQANKDSQEAIAALKEDPNVDGNALISAVLDLYNGSGYTYGNCVLIAIDSASIGIFDKLNGK